MHMYALQSPLTGRLDSYPLKYNDHLVSSSFPYQQIVVCPSHLVLSHLHLHLHHFVHFLPISCKRRELMTKSACTITMHTCTLCIQEEEHSITNCSFQFFIQYSTVSTVWSTSTYFVWSSFLRKLEATELATTEQWTISLTTNQLFANNHEDSGQCKKQQELDYNDSHKTIQSGTTWCLKARWKRTLQHNSHGWHILTP